MGFIYLGISGDEMITKSYDSGDVLLFCIFLMLEFTFQTAFFCSPSDNLRSQHSPKHSRSLCVDIDTSPSTFGGQTKL